MEKSDKTNEGIDVERLRRCVHSSIPISFKTYTLPHETEVYLEKVLGILLAELGQERLKDPLAYCLRELAVNAKKANTKRVYFTERALNLNDEGDYREGMKGFKTDTLENIQYYLEKQKAMGLYVKVTFHATGKTLVIRVRNNTEITRAEQMRVFDRIARARGFATLEEAFDKTQDYVEGAGLGIVILILILRKVGLSEESFSVDMVEGETVATLTIPFSQVHLEQIDYLTQMVVEEIGRMPHFPENVLQLQKLISDPNVSMNEIARQVSTDPSLTADLLKLVNSAQFMLPRRVDNIVKAVKLVGLKLLTNLLYSYGTQKVMSEKYQEMKLLWAHSYRTAFYAYLLARNYLRRDDIVDDVYVGGILHDLGQIVVFGLHGELWSRLSAICKEKSIPVRALENLFVGLNHAEIGSLLAKRWNFPEILVECIRRHHDPIGCDAEYQDAVYTVYLANCVANLEIDRITYEQIEGSVLVFFGVQKEEQFRQIAERLRTTFEDQQRVMRPS